MFRHVYVFSIVMCYLSRTHSLVADETEGLHALILILRILERCDCDCSTEGNEGEVTPKSGQVWSLIIHYILPYMYYCCNG